MKSSDTVGKVKEIYRIQNRSAYAEMREVAERIEKNERIKIECEYEGKVFKTRCRELGKNPVVRRSRELKFDGWYGFII